MFQCYILRTGTESPNAGQHSNLLLHVHILTMHDRGANIY